MPRSSLCGRCSSDVLSKGTRIEDLSLDPFCPESGHSSLVVNARQIEKTQTILIAIEDVTERKRLEDAAQAHAQEVQALAASLLTAQEEERRRVSRELHDEIGQQLASLAIDIGGLAADDPHSRGYARPASGAAGPRRQGVGSGPPHRV